jgi:hypothetical protein
MEKSIPMKREKHKYARHERILLVLLLLVITTNAWAQEEEQSRNWTLNGYLKNLQTGIIVDNSLQSSFQMDHLIHNRLNFRWFPDEAWLFRAELRTRVFYGDIVKSTPNYGQLIDDVNNDYADLSAVLLEGNYGVLHTMLDRIYLQYQKNDWEISLGRQRINWGINTVWNPNDIFNAYNFTDFDYEERPGSDALRIKHYTGFASSVEFVAKAAASWGETVMASRWQFNQWNYDFQVLTGYFRNRWALGAGWAGAIKNVGFKGEWTAFFPLQEEQSGTSFALSLGADYIFTSGFYLNGGYLYNSNGQNRGSITELFSFELSAENLYPYRHAIFLQGSYPVSPLINSGLAIIYSPVEVHPLFLNPSFTVSIANNWDLDLIGQIVLNEQNNRYKSPVQAVFLRVKWSY